MRLEICGSSAAVLAFCPIQSIKKEDTHIDFIFHSETI
jgi:hypothetical protein